MRSGEFEKNRIVEEVQSEFDTKQEFILLGLRMIDGVSIQEYKHKFLTNPVFEFRDKLDKLVQNGLLQIEGDRIRLTNLGLDLANQVWEEFV